MRIPPRLYAWSFGQRISSFVQEFRFQDQRQLIVSAEYHFLYLPVLSAVAHFYSWWLCLHMPIMSIHFCFNASTIIYRSCIYLLLSSFPRQQFTELISLSLLRAYIWLLCQIHLILLRLIARVYILQTSLIYLPRWHSLAFLRLSILSVYLQMLRGCVVVQHGMG